MKPEEIDWTKLDAIIARHREERWGLIPLLQETQETFGYIPPETIRPIAEGLNLDPSRVQGVITFYAGFSMKPRGRHQFKVCCGTACHVKGGQTVLSLMKKELDLEPGETSPDYEYTLDTVACLGACFLAPTMMVGKEYVGKLTPAKVGSVLDHYKTAKKGED